MYSLYLLHAVVLDVDVIVVVDVDVKVDVDVDFDVGKNHCLCFATSCPSSHSLSPQVLHIQPTNEP